MGRNSAHMSNTAAGLRALPKSRRSQTVKRRFTAIEHHAAIMGGYPVKVVEKLAGNIGVNAEDLAKRIGISRTTYKRYLVSKKTLNGLQSDILSKYNSLFHQATEVFDGDVTAAREWLQSSQVGLGGGIPLEFARTTVGFREVEKLLTRIDHGVYA